MGMLETNMGMIEMPVFCCWPGCSISRAHPVGRSVYCPWCNTMESEQLANSGNDVILVSSTWEDTLELMQRNCLNIAWLNTGPGYQQSLQSALFVDRLLWIYFTNSSFSLGIIMLKSNMLGCYHHSCQVVVRDHDSLWRSCRATWEW